MRLLPQSVNGRVFAALVLVVILVNLTSVFFYVLVHDETAVSAAASQAGEQIIVIKRLVEHAPPQDQPEMLQKLSSPLMNLLITNAPIVERSDAQFSSRIVLEKLEAEFPKGTDIRVDSRIDLRAFQENARQVEEDFRRIPIPPDAQVPRSGLLRYLDRRESSRMIAVHGALPALDEALFNVSIKNPEMDTWFNARVLLNLGKPKGDFGIFFWLTGVSILISVIAWWGVNRATRPLSVFASAAERLGLDVNADPLAEEGPSEVQRAIHAFNTMQTRIKRFIQDRTQMLEAISHDLRTPITRLRLRAEFVEDDLQRAKMLGDLDEMEAMIGSTLTFARDDASNEQLDHVDLAAIVDSLCSDQQAAGRDVIYEGPESVDIIARPLALKRAITNFVDNAVKYGKTARVDIAQRHEELAISIDDDGPGIPIGDKERVFAPFVRLETSRSRETGGAGLGLTIARNAVRSMGGDVELINRPEGGLRVKVTLPVPREELLEAAE